jgi:hypothetical protein
MPKSSFVDARILITRLMGDHTGKYRKKFVAGTPFDKKELTFYFDRGGYDTNT